jgi:hypothetical protein
MKKTLAILALSTILLGISVHAPARADDAPAKPAYAVLTDEGLETMLDQMGYAPSKLKKGYLIVIKRDEWTINIQLVLSGDSTKIGINANLGKVEDPDSITADQWKSLLVANSDVDPSSFYFDKEQKKLFLHRAIDNRAVDAAYLRKQIESFCNNMTSTSKLWSFTK